MSRALAAACMLLLCACPAPRHPTPPPPKDTPVTLDQLTENGITHGWKTVAVYLDDADHRMGARFVDQNTGFTLDYLQIESVPEGYIWVNSFPTSDKGEPHTQEHLLLGKGNRGRMLGSSEVMSLATSSAYTEQWRTCYHFNTVAGHDVYWSVFKGELQALLDPDYTDEEIRREVRNFGVDKGDDGQLHLSEKGTVYQEMVRTYEQPVTNEWHTALQLLYGTHHPLSWESGGTPEALRTLTATDIRSFHDANYHLANMGMVAAFPSAMALGDVLDHTAQVLKELSGRTGKVTTEADLPKPAGAAPGTISVVDYPFGDKANPSPVMLAWPATRDLGNADQLLLGLFLDAFAGDESTNLYKLFVDSKTRKVDTGATSVWSSLSSDQGNPVMIGLENVRADHLDDKSVAAMRDAVLAELKRVAALPDGDPELLAFDQRIATRVKSTRRSLTKLLNSPPQFGTRNVSDIWMQHLHQLEKSPGFEKSLTEKQDLATVLAAVSGNANPWRDRLKAWGLLDTPYGVATRPSPDKMAQIAKEGDARVAAELTRLGAQYGTKDAASTLAKYQTDYDAETQKIDDAQKNLVMPPLVDSVPQTLDDDLKYTTGTIAGVPSLSASFGTMTSVRVSVAMRLDSVAPADLMYLAMLPSMMSSVGVYQDGKAISSDEMSEQLRDQILDLATYYDGDLRTGRDELVVEAAGNDLAESKLAVGWMARVMYAPDWRIDNLPRLRDLAQQSVEAARHRWLGPEETWVTNPRDIWWRQRWPLHAHTDSFLTQAHDLDRVRWMLAGSGGKDDATAAALIDGLAARGAKLDRAKLTALAADIAAGKAVKAPNDAVAALVKDAGKDLGELLSDLPDDSLQSDWAYLCHQIASDLKAGPKTALEGFARVRKAILAAGNARVVLIGADANEQALTPDVTALLGQLDTAAPARQTYSDAPFIADNLKAREKGATALMVGLDDPNTQSGVFLDSAPGTSYLDTSDDALLDALTATQYSGHGAHSLFMKTWAAGLAYSNGMHFYLGDGRIEYYAERCPLLPQTLRFVIGQLQAAKPDPNIARYALAQAYGSRSGDTYEERARAMAADLVDGITPDVVRTFRGKLAALAKEPDLADKLFARMSAVYGKVMPGYGPKPADVPDPAFFVIGPDAQLDAYQQYLTTAVGPDAKLDRLYPRDFWVDAK